MTELLPTRARYGADEPAAVEVRSSGAPARLRVLRLGGVVCEIDAGGDGVHDLGALAPGGYGVELVRDDAVVARTAVEVRSDARTGLRYGFVVDYRPDRDLAAFSDNMRRLHLDAVQFYDWAYRHADLLGGGEDYTDALAQPVSLATVRDLVDACHEVGADALGYAAVYAVGPQEWPAWEHLALNRSDGSPYGLGDFLFLVDPAAPEWLQHFRAELAAAVEAVGFDGFHLDQYGYPKRAVRADGQQVDVTRSFVSLVGEVRAELAEQRLIFNNVNDFPTWATGRAPQDAVYVEVWPPHVELGHLAQVATRARAAGAGKPVVVAAYQHVYDSAPAADSDRATAFTMATLFSHGATHLLCGEADRILVDPYYVRNHEAEPSTRDLLRRWYDFLVEHTELLVHKDIVDVTGSYADSYNDDLDVHYASVGVTGEPTAGTVWRRITEVDGRLVVHLINLTGQPDLLWDAARARPGDPGPATVRVRRTGSTLPRVRFADPDRTPALVDVEVRADGDHAVAVLPPPSTWQLVLIDPAQ